MKMDMDMHDGPKIPAGREIAGEKVQF